MGPALSFSSLATSTVSRSCAATGHVLDRAVTQCAAAGDHRVANFSSSVTLAVVNPAVEDQPRADTCADKDRHLFVVSAARAGLVLAPRAHVHVVVHRDTERETLAQFPTQREVVPVQVYRPQYDPVLDIDCARRPNA